MPICHQPLTLRGGGSGKVPQQKLLAHDCGGQPDIGLYSGIQVGVFRSQPSLPHILLHSTLLACLLLPGETVAALPNGRPYSRARKGGPVESVIAFNALCRGGISGYHISWRGASFSLPGAVAKW